MKLSTGLSVENIVKVDARTGKVSRETTRVNIDHVILYYTENEVARDPTSRMSFISAGLEIRTIGCSYVY